MQHGAIVFYRPPQTPVMAPAIPALTTTLYETIGEWRASPHYRPEPKRRVRFWLCHEEEFLVQSYPTAMPARQIAEELGRSLGAVRAKARALGVRRPLRGRAADAAGALTPPPHNSVIQSRPYSNPNDPRPAISRTRAGRIIWDDTVTLHLAELWKRLYSPKYIADYLGTRPGTVSMAAQRAGLPSRAGLTLLKAAPGNNPLAAPENATIAAQMVKRICAITQNVFFLHPKNIRRQHYSMLGQMILARRAAGSVH